MRRDDEDDYDDRDEDEDDRPRRKGRSRRTPDGRVYEHRGCGGQTMVSGGDYTHICDPFWPCTSTFCCGCNSFVPLNEVRWADTGETVSKYRARLRAKTPGLVKAWRFGLGLLLGGVLGALLGLLVGLLAGVEEGQLTGFTIVGGFVGAFAVYYVGTLILNSVYDIDYRRMR